MNPLMNVQQLEEDLRRVGSGETLASARGIWAGQLDALRPAEDITTLEVATKYRWIKADGGAEVPFQIEKTPYLAEIHDALDDPRVRIVAVKGPARSGKTLAVENMLLRVGMFGPARNVLWFMHSEGDLKRYVYERVNFFFDRHTDVGAKIKRRNPAWNLKEIDGQIWEWAPANPSTTRARSASLIVADEIDAMRAMIRDAIITLIRNRQREYGSTAKAYVCSHPDAGPSSGIDAVLVDSDRRIRLWRCPDCGFLSSPCAEADEMEVRRIRWNMAELFKVVEDFDRDAFLRHVAEHVRLICPNCAAAFGDVDRLAMDSVAGGARWIGKGEYVDDAERVMGERVERDTAGFVIHAFMAPFVTLAGLAKEWAGAKLFADETGSQHQLKEVTVKSIGETFRGDEAAARPRLWKQVKADLVLPTYRLREVPDGADFLTANVDVQGSWFAVAIIAWSRTRESWLVDRFDIRQREGLVDLAPGDNLLDWDVLDRMVLQQTYPFADDRALRMPVAVMTVDTGGVPGVTNNARIWTANQLSRPQAPVPPWRIRLLKGDAHAKGDLIQRARKIDRDDAGRELPIAVLERTVNVTDVKKIVANRMSMPPEGPTPGLMHLPVDVQDRHVRELCAETFENGMWISKGRNELWDQWVAGEVARMLMAPDNAVIDWDKDPPSWARPVPASPAGEDGVTSPTEPAFFARFRQLNRAVRTNAWGSTAT